MGLLLKCTYNKGVHAVAQYHFTLCPNHLDHPLRFVCSYYTAGCSVSCTDIGASWDMVGWDHRETSCSVTWTVAIKKLSWSHRQLSPVVGLIPHSTYLNTFSIITVFHTSPSLSFIRGFLYIRF